MPKRTDISKVLIIGSGPIVIGQSAEFDYSGTQACKALKAEGYEVVLVTSNPATITTNNAGEFDADLVPGLYLIRVAKNERFRIPEGVFAVEIDPTAPELVLNLRLWQRCGGLEALKVDE